ncbi:hypothetical protein FOZ60_000359 [Perkinsus olseni]|uniref:Cyclin-dependent kinase 2 homolog n=1 Tax=Perkinsus olseni TaxID=32597 RepID=A0A7J6P3H0_PEROL|nr:hypothetical protein FOZ60_000359 [Perkinsus olseni]
MVFAGAGRRTFHGLVDGVFIFVRWCADLGVDVDLDAVEIMKNTYPRKLLWAFDRLLKILPDLPSEASALHIRGCPCLECRWGSILDHYITTNSAIPTPVVQRLVRKGVPRSVREGAWFWLSGGSAVARDRNPGYCSLLGVDGDYAELIDLDVSRTFCGEKEWQKKGGAKILGRILRAYSLRNPMVGYCQGLSYIGALLLEVCSEEVAFCCLCALVEDGSMPPDYYTSLKGAIVDRLVLEELAKQNVKGLCRALEEEARSFDELFFGGILVSVLVHGDLACGSLGSSLGFLHDLWNLRPIVEGVEDINDLRDLIGKSLNEIGVCDVPDYCMSFNKVTNTVVETLRESKRRRMSREEEIDRKMGKKEDALDRCFLAVIDRPEESPEKKVSENYFQVDRERTSSSAASGGRRDARLLGELEDFMMFKKPHHHRRRRNCEILVALFDFPSSSKCVCWRRLWMIHYSTPRCVEEFDILNEVGKGTYGQVFKAIDKRTQQYVALKRVLLKNEKEGFPVTAVREIKILKRLQHENVVRMLDVVFAKPTDADKHRGSVYMVFEYMDHDLSGVLAYRSQRTADGSTGLSSGNLRPDEVKCIFLQVLRGLDYCHKHNVVHRDLKLSNLLLDKLGHIKDSRFWTGEDLQRGKAQPDQQGHYSMATALVVESLRCGDVPLVLYRRPGLRNQYRPPELLLGTTIYDSKVDTWSAGCILAELIRGKALFPGESETEVYRMIADTLGAPCEQMWPACTQLPNYAQLNEAYQHMRKMMGASASTSSSVRQTGIGLGGSSASTGRLPASMIAADEGRFYEQRQTFRHVFSNTTESGRDLLARLLQCDPSRRLDTAGALNHGYFSEHPLACSAHSLRLSSSRSCHEFTTTNVGQATGGQKRLGAITGECWNIF